MRNHLARANRLSKAIRETLKASGLVLLAGNAIAQNNNLALEEVLVTAQKRAESLQDVPISVSAVDADKMDATGMTRFEDVAAYVPNFTVQSNPISDRISIRGIQSGNQAGFEQSVGIFVDGVYRGRGIQSRFAFIDVAMVEVLRGPQGTLFGKNTIAGALNIRSNTPTEEMEGSLSLGHNVDFNTNEVEAVLSGPVSDQLGLRLFVVDRQQKDGYVDNIYYDEGGPAFEERAIKFSAQWDVSDNTSLILRVENADFTNDSAGFSIIAPGPLAAFGSFASFDRANIGNASGVTNFGSDDYMDGSTTEYSITSTTELGGGTLTALLSHSEYDFERFLDADFSALDGIRFDDTEDFEQDSLEIRFASEAGGTFEYITGIFAQTQSMVVDGLSYFNAPVLQAVLEGGCQAASPALYAAYYDDTNANQTAADYADNSGSAALTNTCFQAAAFEGAPGVSRYAVLDQDTDTWAIFGQGTWSIQDDLRLTLGLRYTEEEKSASQQVYAANYGARDSSEQTVAPLVTLAETIGEFTTHSYSPSDPGMTRTEESLTWSANLQWDVNEETLVYASASTGFKAGGFNSFYMGTPRGLGDDSRDASFEEEEVITFELGSKTTLWNGRAEVNAALYRTEFDDLQTSLFSGNTTFNVENAAQATTQGIEIDARIRASESITVFASLGLMDFEFDQFPNQACTSDQLSAARQAVFDAATDTAGRVNAALGYNNASCAAAGVNDISGETAANAPDLAANLGINHIAQFGRYELNSNLNFNYMDEVYRADDLDPVTKDDAHLFVEASVQLAPNNRKWDLTLIGKNLTDEEFFIYANDVPLFPGAQDITPGASQSLTLVGRIHF